MPRAERVVFVELPMEDSMEACFVGRLKTQATFGIKTTMHCWRPWGRKEIQPGRPFIGEDGCKAAGSPG